MLWNSNQCSNSLNHLSSPNCFVVVVPDETMPVIFAFYFIHTSLLLRHLSLVHGHVSFFIFSLFTLPFNLLWLGQFIAFLRQHFYTLSSNIPPFSPAVRLRDFNSTYFVKFEIAWIRTHSYRSLRCSVSAFIDFRQVDSH